MNVRLSHRSQRDLQRVARQMKEHGNGKDLRKRTIAGIKKGAAPVVKQIKAAARALPARGPKSTGLRARIATATGTQVKLSGKYAGIRVRVSKGRLGPQGPLPQRMNKGKWRHPVYGSDTWVTQTSRKGWFDNEARRGKAKVREEAEQVLDDIEKELRI